MDFHWPSLETWGFYISQIKSKHCIKNIVLIHPDIHFSMPLLLKPVQISSWILATTYGWYGHDAIGNLIDPSILLCFSDKCPCRVTPSWLDEQTSAVGSNATRLGLIFWWTFSLRGNHLTKWGHLSECHSNLHIFFEQDGCRKKSTICKCTHPAFSSVMPRCLTSGN